MIRGGSWQEKADACASASRRRAAANAKDDGIGFRCVKAKAAPGPNPSRQPAGPAAADWPQFLGPNRDGVGAWIEVRLPDGVHPREVTVGGGQAGGSMGWSHMGLGRAQDAEVRVLWPHGEAGDWETLDADGFYVLSPDSPARPWTPD